MLQDQSDLKAIVARWAKLVKLDHQDLKDPRVPRVNADRTDCQAHRVNLVLSVEQEKEVGDH